MSLPRHCAGKLGRIPFSPQVDPDHEGVLLLPRHGTMKHDEWRPMTANDKAVHSSQGGASENPDLCGQVDRKLSFCKRVHGHCREKLSRNGRVLGAVIDGEWSTFPKPGRRVQTAGRMHAAFQPTETFPSSTPPHSRVRANRPVEPVSSAVGPLRWGAGKPAEGARLDPRQPAPNSIQPMDLAAK